MKIDHKRIHSVLIWIVYGIAAVYGIAYCASHRTSFLFLMLIAFWIANLLYFAFDSFFLFTINVFVFVFETFY